MKRPEKLSEKLLETDAEKRFSPFLKSFPKGITPGFQVRAYVGADPVLDVEWGRTWKYYDLASLTKIIFTVPLAMKTVETAMAKTTDPLAAFVPWYKASSRVKDVLTHSAGHDWWKPFFKSLDMRAPVEHRKQQLKVLLRDLPPPQKSKKAVYSDIDFFYLGFVLENIHQKNWLMLREQFKAEALGGADLFFHPNNKLLHSRSDYAPTEKCGWRKRLLQGEVHDENAWALGGIAPHAGLFGSIDGLSQWALWLRSVWKNEDTWLTGHTLRHFAKRAMPRSRGDWAMGFMLPTSGSASCGRFFSSQSFGHTGFTGTSYWFDPVNDVTVVLISNRVHPTRKNEKFREWRPKIHNAIMESIKDNL